MQKTEMQEFILNFIGFDEPIDPTKPPHELALIHTRNKLRAYYRKKVREL